MAASETVLQTFGGAAGSLQGGLFADANGDLFGTTTNGGTNKDGTIFEIAYSATTGYAATPTILASFNGADGAEPFDSLIADAQGDLFGTTSFGGTSGSGTVFELAKDQTTATGYASTPLVLTSLGSGAYPEDTLAIDGNGDLFGTTDEDGAYHEGTLFEVAKTAGGYASATVLVNFSYALGENPFGGVLIDSAGDLLGTTSNGGAHGQGTVFELAKTAGGGYASAPTTLASFSGSLHNLFSGLVADAQGDLFGASQDGGTNPNPFGIPSGAVFELVKTAGVYASSPVILASLGGLDSQGGKAGASPKIGSLLMDADGDLFGTTYSGGAYGDGAVFEIANTPNGYSSVPITVFSFNGTDGGFPNSSLIADAHGDLLGTTATNVFEITDSGFVVPATGPDIFSHVQAQATGPLAGYFLWSNQANWTQGIPVDGDAAASAASGIDDVPSLDLDSLDLTGGGTVTAVQSLTVTTLTADQTSEVLAETSLPGAAGSVTVSIGALAATGGTYGATGPDAVFDDESATNPADADYLASAGGALEVAHDLAAGGTAAGALSVTTGGTVGSVNGFVGTGTADAGTATVDGAGSSWAMSGSLTVGVQGGAGSPSVTVSNGATITTTANVTSYDILYNGSLTLETGAALTESSLDMHDAATLAVESGAVLTETAMDGGLDANGTVTFDAATLASAVADTNVGSVTNTGGAGAGTLTASDGSTLTSLAVALGVSAGDSGTLVLTGPGTTLTTEASTGVDDNSAGLNVGDGGAGSLTVEAGAAVTNPVSYIKVGQFAGATGTALVTGTGSTLSAGGLLRVGDSGTGTLTVAEDATVSAGQVQVGDYASGRGTLDIDSGGQLTTDSASTVDVGAQNGADVAAGSFDVGVQGGSQGTVDVDDGTLTVEADLTVGDAGSGKLSVEDRGTVSAVNGNVGTGAGNAGTVTVDGAGSSWTMSGALTVGVQGGAGSPSLTVSNDAAITTTANQNSVDYLLDGSLTLATGGELTEVELSVHDAAKLTVESGAVLNEVAPTPSPAYLGLYGNGQIVFDDATLSSANLLTTVGGQTGLGGTEAGNGTLTASDGTAATSLATNIGYLGGDSGTLILTGSRTTWTDTYGSGVDANDAGLNVGVSGTGSLTVEAGAVLTNPLAYIKVGQFGGSTGTVLVTGTGSTLSAGGLLRVGDSGTGTLTVQQDGTVSAGQVQVGDFVGGRGTLDIDGGGQLTTNSASTVDVGAQIGGGSTIQVAPGSFDVGVQSGAQGSVDVDGGTLTVGGDLTVGDAGTGSMSVENGGVVSAVNGNVGTGAGNAGSVTVDGAGSTWSMSGKLTIGIQGGAGSPSLTISDGAKVTTAADPASYDFMPDGSLTLETGAELTESGLDTHDGTTLTVESGAILNEYGASPDPAHTGFQPNGTVTFDDATLAAANRYTEIGIATNTGGPGAGTLTASDGTTASNLATDLGEDSGDSGTLTLTGSGTSWTDTYGTGVDANDAGLNVGVGGTGTLTVEAGAVLTNPLAYIKVGQFAGATGTALVTGTGSTLSAGGLLRVGDSGTGTLTVAMDGTVSAGQVQVGDFGSGRGTLDIASGGSLVTNGASTVDVGAQDGADVAPGSFDVGVQSGAQGSVDVDGGTLTIGGNLTVGDAGTGSLSVEAGGAATAANVQIGAGTGAGSVTLGTGGTLTAASVEVGPHGTVLLHGGTLDPPDPVTLDAAGSIAGYGTITGDVEDNGGITAEGGALALSGAVTGAGTLTVAPSATLELAGAISGTVGTFFSGAGATLVLDPGADVGSTVSGFGAGDSIALGSGPVEAAAYDPSTGQLEVTGSDGAVFDLALSGTYQPGEFAVSAGEVTIPCFLKGTRIATTRGEVAVEDLSVGDQVVTASGAARPIVWIGRRSYAGRFVRRNPDVLPIRIVRGALGHGLPARDLWLSPLHALLVDGFLVPAGELVNGTTIRQVPDLAEVHYFHVELDRHDVLLAEGAPAESFLDEGGVAMFHNASERRRAVLGRPGSKQSGPKRYCAPRITHGFELDAIRRRIALAAPPAVRSGRGSVGQTGSLSPTGQ